MSSVASRLSKVIGSKDTKKGVLVKGFNRFKDVLSMFVGPQRCASPY